MSSPDITEAEVQAVLDVLRTPILSIGPRQVSFEKSFTDYLDCKHAIAVSSGTAALHLCMRAAGIATGDLVLTTPFTFISTTNTVLFQNAIPVFVDVDPITGNIDPELTAQAARDLAAGAASARQWLPRKLPTPARQLKALITVDVFGQPADFDPLDRVAREHSLKLVNDSCESLGAVYKTTKTGLLGDYGTFAFYPNKQITTGEGGMIVTNDDAAADLMRGLRNQGRAPGDTWLQHTYLGYNYRLTEIAAALGVVQMSRLETLLANRQRVADWYADALAGIDEIELPRIVPTTTRVSWFVYVIRVAKGLNRDAFAAELERKGIPVRPYFSPIHLQPYMRDFFGYQPGDFPVTEDLAARGLALPFSGKMTQEQVRVVAQAIKSTLTER